MIGQPYDKASNLIRQQCKGSGPGLPCFRSARISLVLLQAQARLARIVTWRRDMQTQTHDGNGTESRVMGSLLRSDRPVTALGL